MWLRVKRGNTGGKLVGHARDAETIKLFVGSLRFQVNTQASGEKELWNILNVQDAYTLGEKVTNAVSNLSKRSVWGGKLYFSAN